MESHPTVESTLCSKRKAKGSLYRRSAWRSAHELALSQMAHCWGYPSKAISTDDTLTKYNTWLTKTQEPSQTPSFSRWPSVAPFGMLAQREDSATAYLPPIACSFSESLLPEGGLRMAGGVELGFEVRVQALGSAQSPLRPNPHQL